MITEEQVERAKIAYRDASTYPIVPANHDEALTAAIEAALEPQDAAPVDVRRVEMTGGAHYIPAYRYQTPDYRAFAIGTPSPDARRAETCSCGHSPEECATVPIRHCQNATDQPTSGDIERGKLIRRAAFEEAARIAERFGEPYALTANTGAMMFRAVTDKIAKAIREAADEAE
ncbi:MAG: hypothetical protein LCH88_08955 [Proteobacteria bacterium]|nr:hypothetical protein [Pseudomonadota bacterium]